MKNPVLIVLLLPALTTIASCSSADPEPTPIAPDSETSAAPASRPAVPTAAAPTPTAPAPPRPAAPKPAVTAEGALVLSGLRCEPPTAWTGSIPESRMRVAEFILPGAEADAEDAQLIVYYFGRGAAGSIAANIDRWCGQVSQPDGRNSREVATTDEREINGLTVHTLDLTGSYVAETTPGSGIRVNKPDSRLLAAIVETDAGPYYFKLMGPSPTIEHWEAGFESMLASLSPASVDGGAGIEHP